MDLVPPSRGRQGRLEARGSGTDHQHRTLAASWRDSLRVPAAAPFLAHRGILCTSQVAAGVVTGDTNVATDTLPDVLQPAFLQFFGEKRIGNGRSGSADEIEHTAAYLAHHRVGRGKSAHADDGFARHRLDEAGVFLLIAFLGKAGRLAVIGPARNVDIPQ